MNRLILMMLLNCCFITSMAYATENKALLANVTYLENLALKKIKHTESQLEKYTDNLNSAQSEAEIERWVKKIKSSEKKIKDQREVLNGIELVKIRLTLSE